MTGSVRWRKSSYSDTENSVCVEVAAIGGRIAVRDSTDPDGPRFSLNAAEWSALLDTVRQLRS